MTILADSFLEDLGSTNGTLVNGRPVVKHFLRDRDQIDIGRQKLVSSSTTQRHHLASRPERTSRDFGERVESAGLSCAGDAARRRHPRRRRCATARGARDRVGDSFVRRSRPRRPRVAVQRRRRAQRRRDAAPAFGGFAAGAFGSDQVLSGVNAGRTIALRKDGTSVGRAGVQVARRPTGTGSGSSPSKAPRAERQRQARGPRGRRARDGRRGRDRRDEARISSASARGPGRRHVAAKSPLCPRRRPMPTTWRFPSRSDAQRHSGCAGNAGQPAVSAGRAGLSPKFAPNRLSHGRATQGFSLAASEPWHIPCFMKFSTRCEGRE